MKLAKGTKYYFISWIVGMPAIFIFNLAIEGDFLNFLILIGAFSLVQLIFLSIRYFVLKIFSENTVNGNTEPKLIESNSAEETETVIPEIISEDNLDGGAVNEIYKVAA